MKHMNTGGLAAVSGLAVLLVFPAARCLAVAGVADTTIIAGDLTDAWKWPRELEQWTQLINQATDQIRRTDELIKIAGDPDALVRHLLTDSVPDLMKPVEDAVGLETRLHALQAAQSLYGLDHVARQTYKDADKVTGAYQAFGEKIERDPKRYAHFAMQEAMYARYKRAVENEEAVTRKEESRLNDSLQRLKTAKTQSEIEIFNARIAASKQRQDLAHQIAVQAKGEMDAFNGQLLVEDARKAAADHEWAQTVVTRLREKALAAYQAQFNPAPDARN